MNNHTNKRSFALSFMQMILKECLHASSSILTYKGVLLIMLGKNDDRVSKAIACFVIAIIFSTLYAICETSKNKNTNMPVDDWDTK